MKSINQTYTINAPIEKVWQALIDPKDIEAWGGGPAKMSNEVGFSFSLWGGDIHGKNIEVVPFKKLKQEWGEKKWKYPSFLTFSLTQKDNKTIVRLLHENVPEESFNDITEGWKDYYMGPLKKYVEEK